MGNRVFIGVFLIDGAGRESAERDFFVLSTLIFLSRHGCYLLKNNTLSPSPPIAKVPSGSMERVERRAPKEAAERLTLQAFKRPAGLIRQSVRCEADLMAYDLDTEDEIWRELYNSTGESRTPPPFYARPSECASNTCQSSF